MHDFHNNKTDLIHNVEFLVAGNSQFVGATLVFTRDKSDVHNFGELWIDWQRHFTLRSPASNNRNNSVTYISLEANQHSSDFDFGSTHLQNEIEEKSCGRREEINVLRRFVQTA